jgi:hypothetical protein
MIAFALNLKPQKHDFQCARVVRRRDWQTSEESNVQHRRKIIELKREGPDGFLEIRFQFLEGRVI